MQPTRHPPGIRPFVDYARIIDARTPGEFAEDHVPGATNLPIVSQAEFAEVGTLHRTDPHRAYVVGAQYALRNVARHIGEVMAHHSPKDRLLVYCFRGGKRSRAWAEPLRNIGFAVDVLPGGWKAYRAWVRESLTHWPGRFHWRVLGGSTASGKTRLLQALRAQGAQVLDLEGLAQHRGSLLGALPGQPQPTQKTFDSELLRSLLAFDPARPVWVEAESKKIGNVQLPSALHDALRAAPTWQVQAPPEARVQVCREDYAHFAADPLALVQRLEPLKPLVGGETLALWRSLAETGQSEALFASVMERHYDPCYARSMRRDQGSTVLCLAGVDAASLQAAAVSLLTAEFTAGTT
ncbi:tRNA 2-selenouridine(34) synthase MnmH [Inhella gelatinilytica]|uniref:tRNA 2-selenouridine(34) synthase MnmH n=1 Tax=Inhella gelatinilytica TaxID=2795030 RepID=A0A931NE16_9BURK|nr:tRNA 2-selenouridine(34) synthase MnmH [Inhella gelatinilytica]MBH9552036.1 tRNA 2-selenouridine(34) synthase MnmH [Inhella gelatinilytica]